MNRAIENRFSQRLVRHHLPLAVVSLAAIWLLDWFVGYWLNTTDPKFFYFRLSLATGYVALVLLVVTLSIGAINILRERRTPIFERLAARCRYLVRSCFRRTFYFRVERPSKTPLALFFYRRLVFTKRHFRVCQLYGIVGNAYRRCSTGNFQRFFAPAAQGEALEIFTKA